MRRHFCDMVDASAVIGGLLRRGRTRDSELQSLQKIQFCVTFLFAISNFCHLPYGSVDASRATVTCRDYEFFTLLLP